MASLQRITSDSASTRWAGSSSPVSAFTRANVWKVHTSGMSSWCFSAWPTTPESQ